MSRKMGKKSHNSSFMLILFFITISQISLIISVINSVRIGDSNVETRMDPTPTL